MNARSKRNGQLSPSFTGSSSGDDVDAVSGSGSATDHSAFARVQRVPHTPHDGQVPHGAHVPVMLGAAPMLVPVSVMPLPAQQQPHQQAQLHGRVMAPQQQQQSQQSFAMAHAQQQPGYIYALPPHNAYAAMAAAAQQQQQQLQQQQQQQHALQLSDAQFSYLLQRFQEFGRVVYSPLGRSIAAQNAAQNGSAAMAASASAGAGRPNASGAAAGAQ